MKLITDYEVEGWLKISAKYDIMWRKSLTNKQVDVVIDYLITNGWNEETKEFIEHIEDGGTYFKIKRRI